ncbi:hypothetical protein [Rhizobium lusitanum]|uniref:Uncharacterized protein n=1 Tax=Rhizobium lusitanum TaxID=293958 RepID=A0A7X0MG07_9HYPH|nr:hypothetical protein [Rhizobium lusitanum]MBB6487568.1 hypothetical protein [Rhizobium lusitanum]
MSLRVTRRCRAHRLRKAAAIAAGEGVAAHELTAMFGWSRLLYKLEVYPKEADKKRLARGASERQSDRM